MDAHFWRTMATSPFVLWFIGLVIFFCQRSGLYGNQKGSRIIYAKPFQQRIFPLTILASFPWIAAIVGPDVYVEMGLTFVGLLPIFAYLAGPSELQIDLDRNTYAAKSGWPMISKVRSGPLSDVSRLDVTYAKGNALLIVRWKQQKAGIIIGSFGTRAKAEAAGTQVARLLGIDVPVGRAEVAGRMTTRS